MQDDHAIADLLSTLARQYRKQIADQALPQNKTRLEIIRKLELITQSIKGLMTHPQKKFSKTVKKRHERRQDKAKSGEKAQFMGDKVAF